MSHREQHVSFYNKIGLKLNCIYRVNISPFFFCRLKLRILNMGQRAFFFRGAL